MAHCDMDALEAEADQPAGRRIITRQWRSTSAITD
jgi:hypothetical protein